MKKLLFLNLYLLFTLCIANGQLSKIWSFKTEGQIFASVVTDVDKAYVGSGDGVFYAIDKTTGVPEWTYQTAGTKFSTALLMDDLICFGSNDGNLYALNKEDGSVVWQHHSKGEKEQDMWDYYLSSPIRYKGVIYWGCGDSYVYAISPKDGSEVWKYKTEGIVHATPVMQDEKLLIGSFDGFLYALNAESGKLEWRFNTLGAHYFPNGAIQKAVLVNDGIVYFGSRDYNLYALEATSGRVLWNYREPHGWIIATPILFKEHLYFGCSDGHQFCCMNAETGIMKWTLPLTMRVFGEAVPVNDKMVFGSHNGILYLVDASEGTVLDQFRTEGHIENYSEVYSVTGSFKEGFELYGSDMLGTEQKILNLGSILSTPTIEEDRIYFGSADGHIYSVHYSGKAAPGKIK